MCRRSGLRGHVLLRGFCGNVPCIFRYNCWDLHARSPHCTFLFCAARPLPDTESIATEGSFRRMSRTESRPGLSETEEPLEGSKKETRMPAWEHIPKDDSELHDDAADDSTEYSSKDFNSPSGKLTAKMIHFVGENKPMPPTPGEELDYRLSWIGPDDPGKPTNWPLSRKLYIVTLYAVANLATVYGAASIGPGTSLIKKEFHVGLPVATLNVSLYIAGFATGPMVWGPMSELTGRKLPITLGALGITIFAFACASAANFQTLVLCRFFGGCLGSSTITIVPAVLSDLFVTTQRGKAMSVIVFIIFAGPMLAPVIGGFIASSFLGWRWTQYIWGIISALSLITTSLSKETYPPRLLAHRAQLIRQETGNWSIAAPIEGETLKPRELFKKTVLKPLVMLSVEPILFLLSIYHGFIYGILYLCLQAVPLIFGDYGWHGGVVFLPYLGMLSGTLICCVVSIFFFEPIFVKKLAASPYPVIPEERLLLMMVSGIFFPAGIFLLCWAGAYKVMWFVPTLGCSFIGFGLLGIFLTAFNYVIDSYLTLAASGMAANTFVRSAFGAAFPLFAHPLFRNLGTQWAGTLLGCLGSLLAPVPFLFYFYGVKIRSFSKYAAALETDNIPLSPHSSTHESN